MESEIRLKEAGMLLEIIIQILESIRNPRRAIQNPRLSWPALHGVAVRHVSHISASSPYMHFLVSGNVGDHGGVEINATEEQIEIRVIKEDKDVRRSLKGTTTSFNNLAVES